MKFLPILVLLPVMKLASCQRSELSGSLEAIMDTEFGSPDALDAGVVQSAIEALRAWMRSQEDGRLGYCDVMINNFYDEG